MKDEGPREGPFGPNTSLYFVEAFPADQHDGCSAARLRESPTLARRFPVRSRGHTSTSWYLHCPYLKSPTPDHLLSADTENLADGGGRIPECAEIVATIGRALPRRRQTDCGRGVRRGVFVKRLVLIIGVVSALAPTALAAAPLPVPSLTPAATAKLWRAEVARARAAPQARLDLACTPSRAVFYAQTDWLRLATKLAQAPSPCSQYFVSVPPLAADKTQARPGQAASIRALGADFHAVDEISYTGWSGWVGAGNGTWYDAGVAARGRMAAAGFDVSAGDTWALNELSSAVRKGTAAARRNALDFLHGLAADGTKGIVFAAGVGQSTPDPSQYKVNLQDWLQDGGFWTEASAYVSDFAPENYGDVRNYAVPGTSPQQRRDALLQYLAHEGTLANAGPASTAAARSVLGQTYVTFGNAAWAWDSAYGWTSVPLATMQDFVSGQVDAARSFAQAAGEAVDRFGFAWSPNNTLGLSPADFNTQTASLLDRIAAAIRDTSVPSADAGSAACAPTWCTTTLADAAFAPQWQQFATWSPTVPAFTSAPFSATAGTPSGTGRRRAPDPRDGRQCGRRPDADARLRLPDRGLRARERRPVVADAHTDDSGRLGGCLGLLLRHGRRLTDADGPPRRRQPRDPVGAGHSTGRTARPRCLHPHRHLPRRRHRPRRRRPRHPRRSRFPRPPRQRRRLRLRRRPTSRRCGLASPAGTSSSRSQSSPARRIRAACGFGSGCAAAHGRSPSSRV